MKKNNPFLGNKPKLLAALVSQILAIQAGISSAADIFVTELGSGTGGPGCSIRDAITAANTDSSIGGCTAGSAADRIHLPIESEILLDVVDNGYDCLPQIGSPITIIGDQSTIRRSNAAPECGILRVGVTGSLNLENTTVAGGNVLFGGGIRGHGDVVLQGSTISGNVARDGGGIRISGANLQINQSVVCGNFADRNGGAISAIDSGVTIVDSLICDNESDDKGGGIHNEFSNVLISDSVITGNNAFESGGGLFSGRLSRLDVYSSDVTNNSSHFGGGVYLYDDFVDPTAGERGSLVSSTISGNNALVGDFFHRRPAGGGLFIRGIGSFEVSNTRFEDNQSEYLGGGMLVRDVTIEVNDSTFVGNRSQAGGGANFQGSSASIADSTFQDNEAFVGAGISSLLADVRILRSTITGNRAIAGTFQNGDEVIGKGGGLRGRYSYLYMSDSTISGNSSEGQSSALEWRDVVFDPFGLHTAPSIQELESISQKKWTPTIGQRLDEYKCFPPS